MAFAQRPLVHPPALVTAVVYLAYNHFSQNEQSKIKEVAREKGVDRKQLGKAVEQAKKGEGRGGADNLSLDEIRHIADEIRDGGWWGGQEMTDTDSHLDDKAIYSAGASFRIQGLDLAFEDITRDLDIEPTHTHSRGERGILDKSLPYDLWMLDSPLPDSCDLELHIEWLAERLLPHKQSISILRKNLKIDIYCYKTCYTEQSSLTLSAHVLRIFTELSLELCVSLIFLPDEPNETKASSPSKYIQPAS